MKTVFNTYDNGVTVPFIEADDGELYIPINVAAGSLGLESNSLRHLVANNPDDFSCSQLKGILNPLKELLSFVRNNKELFKTRRVRENMIFLTEDDYLVATVLCRTPVGREARRNFVRWQKERATRNCVSMEQLKEVMAQLVARDEQLASLQEQVDNMSPFLKRQASNAGQTLALHKRIRENLSN